MSGGDEALPDYTLPL